MIPARVTIRLVPAHAGHDSRALLDALARIGGYCDLSDLRVKALARRDAERAKAKP